MLSATLLIAYEAALERFRLVTMSTSACPLEIAMTFFAVPLRIRGVKRLKRWICATVLVLKFARRFSSRALGSLPLCFYLLGYATKTEGHSRDEKIDGDVQDTNRIELVVHGEICGVGNEVVEAPACDLCGVGGCGLERLVVVQVTIEDVDVGASRKFLGNTLLGPGLVADESDDGVVSVAGEVGEECPLRTVSFGHV
jgi:hypothetical protein